MPHDCLGPEGMQLAEWRWVWVWKDRAGDDIVISGSTEFEVLVVIHVDPEDHLEKIGKIRKGKGQRMEP